MTATTSILLLDARGVMRDNVMLYNVGISFVGTCIIAGLGLFHATDQAWLAWYPFLVIMAIITNPSGYGFLFGLLMVDEKDTGVRSALSVSPVRPTTMLTVRMVTSTALMIIWPITSLLIMDATWKAIPVSYMQLLAIVVMLAPVAPLTALSVASYAANKVEALAVFKGISFVVIAPLALKFIAEDAAFRPLFLLSPTAWGYFSFDAFVAGSVTQGYLYVMGGLIYCCALLAFTVRFYLRQAYKIDA